MATQTHEVLARSVRDDAGDTIFAIDVDAEDVLLRACEDWGRAECFRLIAEGLEPEGRVFGRSPHGPSFVLIVDPIDGTRGLMFDKRSAWSLAAIAPERGAATRLSHVTHAAMTELPTTRQGRADQLFVGPAGGVEGRCVELANGTHRALAVQPSRATDLRHGFATTVAFFPGGKELAARIDEAFIGRALGGWNPEKAESYADQYICSGGQLAELALGRDRFVLDLRPWLHAALGVRSSLCARPYDVCTAAIAERAGCVIRAPNGGPLDPPLDLTTNVAFVGYANRVLADRLQPLLAEVLREHLGDRFTAPVP
jgi:hypothetical protein